MKSLIKSIVSTGLLFVAFLLMSADYERTDLVNDNKDSANIAIIQFTVQGLDSANVAWVQDRLDTVKGITFNFACWADTIIFIEYDSLKTNECRLKEVIKKLGYNPKPREL